MKSARSNSLGPVLEARIESLQINRAEREAARRQLGFADDVAGALLRGFALLRGLASSHR
jgi:hypothetical protein